ncbi:hypothetical protein [Hydrogenothermus marinus]|uniref:hypothetical protein n=1 Tax=Hydrogenothermus marinus TaxID=133270 RepID=UPI000EFA0451|nr:hypothetical protein [Hydrogenothermus marinus]
MDETKDYLLNRRVTVIFGISFLFIFFAAVVSEILSLILDEGLLSPPIVAFHVIAFIGYILTLRYVLKKQPWVERKNREIIKEDMEKDRN